MSNIFFLVEFDRKHLTGQKNKGIKDGLIKTLIGCTIMI